MSILRLNDQNPLDLNGFDFKVSNKISILILRFKGDFDLHTGKLK